MSAGKLILKQQWDTTTYLLEWPKFGTLTTQNAGKGVEQQELSFIVGGMQNGTATLEDNLAVCYETKHTLTIYSSNHTPWYLPKGVEHFFLYKNLYTDVYSSFIHTYPGT